MGYDLYYAEPTGRMLTAKNKADEAYENQTEGWFDMPQPYYYRFSIFSGQRMRDALSVTGLLTYDVPEPSFPPYENWAEGSDMEKQYRTHIERIIDADYGSIIPSFKLSSNDGWLITPAEIQRGVDRGMVERGLLSIEDKYERDFVRWVIRSMKHGGFRTF